MEHNKEELEVDHYQQFIQGKKELEEEPLDAIDFTEYGEDYVPQSTENALQKPIKEDNKGYKLLLKMGWRGGTDGLGKEGQGNFEPLAISLKSDTIGLGKEEEMAEYTDPNLIHRTLLNIEKEIEMTNEEKFQKLERASILIAREGELEDINKVFHCEICDKGYKKVCEWENHLSSYDHNHKKRFMEMKASEKEKGKDMREKKRKREEEKEIERMRAMAAAAKDTTNNLNPPETLNNDTAAPAPGERTAVKFGFSMMQPKKGARPVARK